MIPVKTILILLTATCFTDVFLHAALADYFIPEGSPSVIVNVVSEFGVKANGSDNAKKLIEMRDVLIKRNRSAHWILLFDKNEKPYLYSNNRWLNGFKYVTVSGYGVKFKNISSLRGGQDTRPFDGRGITQAWGDENFTGAKNKFIPGVPFTQNALKNQRSIKIKDTNNIKAEDEILVAGFSQQKHGYPFNARYFEFTKVKEVKEGELVLSKPLEYSYNLEWHDDDYGLYQFGKPRVYNLIRLNYYYPDYISIRGVEFLHNSNAEGQEPLVFSARNVVLKDIKGDFDEFKLWIRETELTIVENSLIGGWVEIDKQVKQAIIRNNVIHGGKGKNKYTHAIKAGTSCEYLVISDNVINNRVNVVCGVLYIINNDLNVVDTKDGNNMYAISYYNNTYGGDVVTIVNNNIVKRVNQKSISPNKILLSKKAVLNGQCLLFKKAEFANELIALRPGSNLYSKDDTVIGVVIEIEESGVGEICVTINWLNSKRTDTQAYYYGFKHYSIESNKEINH